MSYRTEFEITTHLTDIHGKHKVRIGQARTHDKAKEMVDHYFDYVRYEGVDSIDIEAMDNVRIKPVMVETTLNNGCHYCGAPAVTFDYFEEPACEGCS